MITDTTHDLIIIGTGPAGYTAAIYAGRYRIDTLLIGTLPGGQITEAHKICNFPGYTEISGMELGQLMQKHAKNLDSKEITDVVLSIKKESHQFVVKTGSSGTFHSRAILLAYGTKRRKLNLPNEQKYLGKGISYCATCDGTFYSNKVVGVIGGSNAATTAALLLSDIANKVYVIYRGNGLKGDQIWINQLYEKKNIEVVLNKTVVGLQGDKMLSSVKLDTKYKEGMEIKLDGLFVEIGSIPSTEIVENLNVTVDEKNYIKVSGDQSTNIEGVYAAGDITDGSNKFRQVITACSEGAVSANSIFKFLKN